jgi:signal transduction histidine kinase
MAEVLSSITAPAPAEPEREGVGQLVRGEQFSLIFAANRVNSPIAILAALVFWAFLYWRLRDPWILVWAAFMHASQLLRELWVRRHAHHAATATADPAWGRPYVALLTANGAIWALALPLFFPAHDVLACAFMVLAILGVHSGGTNWMVPVKAAVLGFSLPMMVSLGLTLALQDEVTYRVAACLCLFYLYSSWTSALQHNKWLEDALRARYENQRLTDQLEEQVELVGQASREKSRFLAAASHDLRQPMHAMALFSAALERELAGMPQQASAAHLQGAVRALSESLDTMLDISRLDAGVVPVHMQAVPLQQTFQSINRMYAAQAEERGLELRVRATSLWVMSDARLLERMLSNLVSNALKYTGHGGVLVAARRIGKAVVVDVTDTGIGIAPDQQRRVFDEFYQVNNAARDRSQGLGIGLAIVRRLGVLLDHGISLVSTPGRGSRFRVALPPAAAGEAPAPFDALQSGRFAASGGLPRRVLVLDDEADILAGVRSLLEAYAVQVTTAQTTDDALAALQAAPTPFEAFLCDIRLADNVDGLDFAMRLPSLVRDAPPTLLITGETGPQPLQRVRDAGLPVLFKPVAAGPLLDALVRVRRMGGPAAARR